MMKTEPLALTEEWDKTFPQSDRVDHQKVTFVNRFGITLAADMYTPKTAPGRLPAIAVCGPFGAVKEQCSGLHAQTMAERGFITLAFDPSFTGESGGRPLVRGGLLRLLQDAPGLSSPFPELQRRLEHHGLRVVPQSAHPSVQP